MFVMCLGIELYMYWVFEEYNQVMFFKNQLVLIHSKRYKPQLDDFIEKIKSLNFLIRWFKQIQLSKATYYEC